MLEKLSPEHLSYLIGLWQTDGSHNESERNRGRLSCELSFKDKDILEKCQRILKEHVTANISERTRDTNFGRNKKFVSLNICNYQFRQEIKPFVPTGKKSSLIEKPRLSNLSERDYIRGLSDGDGSVGVTSNNRPFWSFVTQSEPLKDYLLNNIELITGERKKVNRNKRDNIFNIVLFDESAVKYLDYLYKSSELYMERKFVSYQKAKRWIRTTPQRKGKKISWDEKEDNLILDSSLSLDEKVLVLKRTKSSIKTRLWRLKGNN